MKLKKFSSERKKSRGAILLILIIVLLIAGTIGLLSYYWSSKHIGFSWDKAKKTGSTEVAQGILDRIIKRIDQRMNPANPWKLADDGAAGNQAAQWEYDHWLAQNEVTAASAIRRYAQQFWCEVKGSSASDCPSTMIPTANSGIYVKSDNEFTDIEYSVDIVSVNPFTSSDSDFYFTGINLNQQDKTDDWAHRLVVEVVAYNKKTEESLGDDKAKHRIQSKVSQDILLVAERPYVNGQFTVFANVVSNHTLHAGHIFGVTSQWYDVNRLADYDTKQPYYQFGVLGYIRPSYLESAFGAGGLALDATATGTDNYSGYQGKDDLLPTHLSLNKDRHDQMSIGGLITRAPIFQNNRLSPTMRTSNFADDDDLGNGLQIKNKNIKNEINDPWIQPSDYVHGYFHDPQTGLPRPGIATKLGQKFQSEWGGGRIKLFCPADKIASGEITNADRDKMLRISDWRREDYESNPSTYNVQTFSAPSNWEIHDSTVSHVVIAPTKDCYIQVKGTVFIDGDVVIGGDLAGAGENAYNFDGRGSIVSSRNIYLTNSLISRDSASRGSSTGDCGSDCLRNPGFNYKDYEEANFPGLSENENTNEVNYQPNDFDRLGLAAANSIVIGNLANSQNFAYSQTFTNAELNYYNLDLSGNGDVDHILADGRFGLRQTDGQIDTTMDSRDDYQVGRGTCSAAVGSSGSCGATWPGLLPEGSNLITDGFPFYYIEDDAHYDGYGYLPHKDDAKRPGSDAAFSYDLYPYATSQNQSVNFAGPSWISTQEFRKVAADPADGTTIPWDSTTANSISRVREIHAKLFAGGVITGLASFKDKLTEGPASPTARTNDPAFFDNDDPTTSLCDENNDGLQIYGGLYAKYINLTSVRGLCVINDNRQHGILPLPIQVIRGRDYKEDMFKR